jgi:alpha,alpha-trehalase
LRRRDDWVAEELSTELEQGRSLRVEKIVALYTIRDRAISNPTLAACHGAGEAPDFAAVAETHQRAWADLWSRFEIETGCEVGDGVLLRARANVFHLLQTTSPYAPELDAGIPARGWHGEAYRGHIFWDEIFILPLLNLRLPSLSRDALLYRYRRLPAARRSARQAGYRGAMYPWQSGSSGREESQELHLNPDSGRWIPDDTHRQRHIGSAIAYNIWSYYEITDDRDFLCAHGAEMLLEIARFWAGIATYDGAQERYEIRGVTGPDEYHTGYPDADPQTRGLANNAYTNVMAAWVLGRALHMLDVLPPWRKEQLLQAIDLQEDEIESWHEISRKLRICFHGDGIISQFEGYERLEEFDWERYREKYGDIQRLDRILEAEGDTTNRYKVSKQADVLMLFYLFSADELRLLFEQLGYPFDDELIPRNIEYYLARTSHGSTLSRVTHSWVLARSDRSTAWRLLLDALDSDLSDIQGGTTEEGVHLGAMAGSVDLLLRGLTGVEPRSGILHFNPCLPPNLGRLTFSLRYRHHLLQVEIDERTLAIDSQPLTANPIRISYRGRVRSLSPGEGCRFRLLTPEERKRAGSSPGARAERPLDAASKGGS